MNSTELLLHRLGFRRTYKGFRYLCQAIELALEDDTCLTQLTKSLYPAVARRCGSTAPAVERSLRTAIDVIWNQGDVAALEKLIGYKIRQKPYVGKFIDILAGYLQSLN